jgi:hypothetical protein
MSINETEQFVNNICKLYPELAKDKNYILDQMIKNKTKKPQNETVLTKIEYNGKSYYRDDNIDCLWDKNLKWAGAFEVIGGNYIYYINDGNKCEIKHLTLRS